MGVFSLLAPRCQSDFASERTTIENNHSWFQQNTKVWRLKAALRNMEPSLDSLVAVTLHHEGSHLNTPVLVLWLPFASCDQLNRERKQWLLLLLLLLLLRLLLQAAARPWLVLMKTCGKCLRKRAECVPALRVCGLGDWKGGVGQWRVEAMLVLSLCNETNCNAKARRERRNRAGFGGRLISENPPVRVDAYFTLSPWTCVTGRREGRLPSVILKSARWNE